MRSPSQWPTWERSSGWKGRWRIVSVGWSAGRAAGCSGRPAAADVPPEPAAATAGHAAPQPWRDPASSGGCSWPWHPLPSATRYWPFPGPASAVLISGQAAVDLVDAERLRLLRPVPSPPPGTRRGSRQRTRHGPGMSAPGPAQLLLQRDLVLPARAEAVDVADLPDAGQGGSDPDLVVVTRLLQMPKAPLYRCLPSVNS
jgi:hypothetical protein